MAIKIIKFDLPINGTKVTTLEALRDNLTDEIVQLARSGQLERWFKSRQLQELAKGVADAVARHTQDKALFMALCAVLEVEVHPEDASAIFDVPPKAGHSVKGGKYFELYEELKKSHEEIRELARNRIFTLESGIKKMVEPEEKLILGRSFGWPYPSGEIEKPVQFNDKKFLVEIKNILKNSIEI